VAIAKIVTPGREPVPLDVYHLGGAKRLFEVLRKGLADEDEEDPPARYRE